MFWETWKFFKGEFWNFFADELVILRQYGNFAWQLQDFKNDSVIF